MLAAVERRELRAVFDEDAELYDRARPGYPAALFADLARLGCTGRGRRVLEIGPGTGQATAELAAGGASVVAVELGASLAAVLQRRTSGLDVEVVVADVERWAPPEAPFDTVAAFTAWHWLDPVSRAERVAALLRPGGALATVTTTHVAGGSAGFFADMQDCYRRVTGQSEDRPEAEAVPVALDDVDRSPLFAPALRRRYTAEADYSVQAYLDLLSTYSDHRALGPERMGRLLTCVGRIAEERYGGRITMRYLYELRVAHRRAVASPVSGSG